jgi:type II secretory ATPase GspE/PulE/Tfp pilus assembly ATPase PilB-like protein
MTTLRDNGIRKLALGVTSFEEVVRVLGESA